MLLYLCPFYEEQLFLKPKQKNQKNNNSTLNSLGFFYILAYRTINIFNSHEDDVGMLWKAELCLFLTSSDRKTFCQLYHNNFVFTFSQHS